VCTARPCAAQQDPQSTLAYRAELRAGREAEGAGDAAGAQQHYIRALDLMHGHPDLFYMVARAEARLGHAEAAVSRLQTLAAMGLVYPVDSDSAFSALRRNSAFAKALASMAENRGTVTSGAPAYRLLDPELLAEDIAYDPTRRLSCLTV
jgi:hypothetical protein